MPLGISPNTYIITQEVLFVKSFFHYSSSPFLCLAFLLYAFPFFCTKPRFRIYVSVSNCSGVILRSRLSFFLLVIVFPSLSVFIISYVWGFVNPFFNYFQTKKYQNNRFYHFVLANLKYIRGDNHYILLHQAVFLQYLLLFQLPKFLHF